MKTLDRLLTLIENAALAIGFGSMAVVLFADSVLSGPLHFSWPWAREFSLYMMLWVMGAGAGVAAREGRHIAVDAIVRLLPRRPQEAVRRGVSAVCAAACGAAMWPCIAFVRGGIESGLTAQSIGIPIWYAYLALPFTAGLLCLRFAVSVFIPPTPDENAAGGHTL